jgi:hypothetical protein
MKTNEQIEIGGKHCGKNGDNSLPNVPHHLPRKAGTPDADGKGAA